MGQVAPAPRASRNRRDPVVPPQHGAWGFLGLPLLLGVAVAGWSWWVVPLTVAWVAAYPTSWALTGLLTAKRPGRFWKPLAIWTPLCVVAGVPLVVAMPWLLAVGAGYGALFGVNLLYARARRERSLSNDLVLIAECVLFVPVVAGVVGGADTADVLVAGLACALTLVGSTLHVKSLIRERRNPAYTLASRLYAGAAPVVMVAACLATGEPWWLAAPFVLLAARAIWWHDPTWRPARIGLVELAGLLAVAATGFAAW